MNKQLWLNVAVKDVKKAHEFYTALGFEAKTEFSNPMSETVVFNDGTLLMLVGNDFFKRAAKRDVADTKTFAEVVLATQVDTRADVDDIVDRANKAGAEEIGEAFEHEGMYTRIFRDLDGHQFNVFAFV
jgi:predicted lactoylglutathione lyase